MALFSSEARSGLVPLLTFLGAGLALAGPGCGSDDDGPGGPGAATSGPTSSGSGGAGGSGAAGGAGGAGGATTSSTTTGAGGSVDCGATASGPAPALQLMLVASGLNRPLFVTAAPGDDERLFVVEQAGRIRVVANGSVQQAPFLDIDALIPNPGGADEYGLLGLAFHPDYAQNGRFFVFYVNNDGDSVLAEYARSASDPGTASPAPVQTLLTLTGGGGHHYAGAMAFGKDGYLYVASGDRGVDSNGQNVNVKLSKMLRIDADAPSTPPPGNMPGGDPLIWDYGLRNAWRFSVDRCSGDLYIGDVGGNYEEVNVEQAGQGHRNYGWASVDTGTECNGATCPVWAGDHNFGDCSMIAGYVYRGSAIPNMNGRFIFGDYCTNRIRTFLWTATSGVTLEEDLSADLQSTDTLVNLSSFGEDNQGNVYVVDLAGGIYRIDAE